MDAGKKYYKFEDEIESVGKGYRYLETDQRGALFREVAVIGEITIGSNIKYPLFGIYLTSGAIDYDDISEVTPIDKVEFDQVWSRHLQRNHARWLLTKNAYTVGQSITGYVEGYVLLGTLVDLGKGALGIADTGKCNASTAPTNTYSRNKITAIVAGYDEQNQWIILDSPTLHAERRELPDF